MTTFIFVIFLIFAPMYMFTLCRRVFRIFRFVPYLMREVIVPHLYTTQEIEGEKKINLSPEKIKIIENSVLTSSLEVNPKRFSKRTKKRLSTAFTIIGLVILVFVLYKVFWFVYDYIVLTFF